MQYPSQKSLGQETSSSNAGATLAGELISNPNTTEGIKVRDYRNKAMFKVDDAYLDNYATLCGTNATLVYLCLCRHAGRQQESFPSVETMAKRLGISRDSVMRGIKKLIEWNIISKLRKRRTNQTWFNNIYTLLDKSVWKSKPSSEEQHGQPSRYRDQSQVANDATSQVAESDTKGAHFKETHNEGHGLNAQSALEIETNNFLKLFKEINPSYGQLFKKNPEREAARRLLKLYGFEWWSDFFNVYASMIRSETYCPRATTPLKIEVKLGDILAYGASLRIEYAKPPKSKGRGLEL